MCERASKRGCMNEAVSLCVFLLACSLRACVFVYMCLTAWLWFHGCVVCGRVIACVVCSIVLAYVRACLVYIKISQFI